jgi:hypothetical protein
MSSGYYRQLNNEEHFWDSQSGESKARKFTNGMSKTEGNS